MKKNKYKDYYVSQKTVSTAIFEYLERKGLKVNRKKGITFARSSEGWDTGGKFVQVESYEKN